MSIKRFSGYMLTILCIVCLLHVFKTLIILQSKSKSTDYETAINHDEFTNIFKYLLHSKAFLTNEPILTKISKNKTSDLFNESVGFLSFGVLSHHLPNLNASFCNKISSILSELIFFK